MKKIDKKIEDALIKKALGYTLTETCEEYVKGEDEIVLNKKKVTQKDVAPDVSALKLLIDYLNINDKEIETYNQIDKELSNNINAINFELSALNSNYEDALNNFDIEYASKLAEKINTATEKLKAEQEKVIKYNNEIAEKEAEFNQSLTKLEQDIKDSEWDKEIDAMNLYGKYGTLVVEKYKNNKMYNTALNYFSNFSNEKALYLLEGNPEFKTLLGEATYNKLLENFK